MAELAPDAGGRLRHFLDRLQPVQPRHQAVMQRGGDGDGAERSIQNQPVAVLFQRAGFKDRLGQFLDKQRHAVGALRDDLHDLVRQRLAVGQLGDDVPDLILAQPVQRKARHDGMPAKAILEAGTRRGEDHDRLIGDPIQQQVQQLQRGRIDPVQVFVDQQHRLFLALLNQQLGQRLHRVRPLLGWRQVKRTVSRGAVQTHHRRDQLQRIGVLPSSASSLSSRASGPSDGANPAAKDIC